MWVLIFSFLITFIKISYEKSKIIKEDFVSNHNSYEGYFIFEKTLVRADIDMQNPFSYVSNNTLSNLTSAGEKATVFFGDQTHSSYFHRSFFSSQRKEYHFDEYPFYVVYFKNIRRSIAGVSFAYKHSNLEFSFIYLLHKNSFIKQRSFTFGTFNSRKTSGNLYLGGTPKELVLKKYENIIPIDETHQTWGFKLNSIEFTQHDKKYDNQYYAYLTSNNDRIFAPEDVLSYINKAIFDGYYKNKTCTYYKKSDEQRYINCECDKIHTFPDLVFTFGDDFKVTWTYKESFKLVSNKMCLFLILSNPYEEGKWMFGSMFFRAFVTEFNYDKNKIIFYSEKPLGHTSKIIDESSDINAPGEAEAKIYRQINIVLNILLLICILGVFIILFMKIKSLIGF